MRLLYLTIMIAAALSARAQATTADTLTSVYPEHNLIKKAVQSTKIIVPGELDTERRDSMERLIANFYVDQYRNFQDPRSPYFLFMSKDANLALGVGGVVRMRGWYDFDGSVPVNGFVPYLIPVPADPTARKKLGATPAGTALFLTILGRNTPFGNVMGFIQGGFSGYDNIDFKLKKAYVIINDWTIGYTTSTFIDQQTQPPTIDGAGPNGFATKTQVLLRYFKTFKDSFSVGGGIEIPSSQPAVDNVNSAKCNDYIPDIAVLGQYQWDQGLSHIRLSGLLHFNAYRDLVRQENHTVAGYGVQLSGITKITPAFNLYAGIIWGRGIGSYMADLSVDRYDLVADADTPGKMYAPNSLGYTIGAQYYFKHDLYGCIVFGQMRYFPEDTAADMSYRYGTYGAANIFWDMTSRLQIGIEYLYGRRTNFDHSCGHANRIDALFQLSF